MATVAMTMALFGVLWPLGYLVNFYISGANFVEIYGSGTDPVSLLLGRPEQPFRTGFCFTADVF